MIITIRDKAIHIALRRREKRDFEKERRERQVWREQCPQILLDIP